MNPFEPNYRGPGEGPRGPFNPSGASPRKNASGCPLQPQHLPQIVTHPLEPATIVVGHPTDIATSRHPRAAFQGADDHLLKPARLGAAGRGQSPTPPQIAALILCVYFMFGRSGGGSPWQHSGTHQSSGREVESPLDILKRRYAKGEITKDEFDQMKEDIHS